MKSDKELLKELVEYSDNVMVDTEEGKPFEDREVPDYRGHELEFKIDMVIDFLHDMMCTYPAMRNFIFRPNDKQNTGDNMCCANINEFLEKYEKRMNANNKKNE